MIIVMNLGKNRRPECEITLINTLTFVKASIQIERAHRIRAKTISATHYSEALAL